MCEYLSFLILFIFVFLLGFFFFFQNTSQSTAHTLGILTFIIMHGSVSCNVNFFTYTLSNHLLIWWPRDASFSAPVWLTVRKKNLSHQCCFPVSHNSWCSHILWPVHSFFNTSSHTVIFSDRLTSCFFFLSLLFCNKTRTIFLMTWNITRRVKYFSLKTFFFSMMFFTLFGCLTLLLHFPFLIWWPTIAKKQNDNTKQWPTSTFKDYRWIT